MKVNNRLYHNPFALAKLPPPSATLPSKGGE